MKCKMYHNNKKKENIDSTIKINNSSTVKREYPAALLMLSEIKDIYNDENERQKTLENKASLGLTFVGVLLTIGISELPIINITKVNTNDFLQIILNLVLVISLILMISMLILATYNLHQSIKTRPYQKMSTKGFINENGEKEEEIIAMVILKIYKKTIKKNRVINDKKSKYIDKSIIYLIICVISYVIYSLIYKIIY